MDLHDLHGVWTIDDSSIDPLIAEKDEVSISVIADEEASVRIRRKGVTVFVGSGYLEPQRRALICPQSYCVVEFWGDAALLKFHAVVYDGGPTPEGGGTSVGPPKPP